MHRLHYLFLIAINRFISIYSFVYRRRLSTLLLWSLVVICGDGGGYSSSSSSSRFFSFLSSLSIAGPSWCHLGEFLSFLLLISLPACLPACYQVAQENNGSIVEKKRERKRERKILLDDKTTTTAGNLKQKADDDDDDDGDGRWFVQVATRLSVQSFIGWQQTLGGRFEAPPSAK